MNIITATTTSGIGYLWYAIFLALGVFLLVKGADLFVGGAASISRKLKIPAIVIGLTVVSFGTSAPELAVSLSSSIKGDSGIAMGNVVGSNIMNLLVVLGFSSIISPIIVKKSLCKREFPFLIGTTILLIIFALFNFFSKSITLSQTLVWYEGIIFVLGIVAFCYMSIVLAKKDQKQEEIEASDDVPEEIPLVKSIIFLILGLAAIIGGSELVTTPAKVIATSLGVAIGVDLDLVVNVVGLTVVAIGTSLPELVTSIFAAKKNENEIAIGNVVGSNIFNILFICGLSSLFVDLAISKDILTDMFISLLATILVLFICLRGKITKKAGGLLILLYLVYLAYILYRLFNPGLVLPL